MPDGTWMDAPYIRRAHVNIGDLLARWTGDRWRSPGTACSPAAEAPDEDLLSLIFFYEANTTPWWSRYPARSAATTFPPVSRTSTSGRAGRDRRHLSRARMAGLAAAAQPLPRAGSAGVTVRLTASNSVKRDDQLVA